MASSGGKLSIHAAIALGGVVLLGGCKYFDISNPFLPSSRFIATPSPTMIDVKYSYSLSTNVITITEQDPKFTVQSLPNDGTPGLYINGYSADYVDEDGQPIPSLLIAKSQFPLSAYAPPASTGTPSSIQLSLPVYNQQVKLYGEEIAFSLAGGPSLNRHLSSTITCRVTLYGQDDNFNQIQLPMSVPIRFDADITQ